MFAPEGSVRVWLCTEPTDMRKSFDGLSAMVKHTLGDDPLSGHLFCFINRRRTQMRILYFDRTGYAIWAKRLERGLFVAVHDGEIKKALSFAELQCLLEGIEVRGARKYKRFSLRRGRLPRARRYNPPPCRLAATTSEAARAPTPSSRPRPPPGVALTKQELVASHHRLEGQVAELARQLEWFRKQLFGAKSEKRIEPNPHQMVLGEAFADRPRSRPSRTKETITYTRGKGPKARPDDCVTDEGLRFGPDVPVKTIRLAGARHRGRSTPTTIELIDTKVVHRLAQRPASYVVIRYEMPVVKLRGSGEIRQAPPITPVIDRSLADVSRLAGLLVDKFRFHLPPLHRQHQRIEAAGVRLARSTLTNLVGRAIALLEPIVDAQLQSVLRSRTLAMDETPIKVGRSRTKKGRMHQGYYWPLYGERDEVVFTYSDSRARRQIERYLGERFEGTLLTDGFSAYRAFVAATEGVVHAQCWAHTRRHFVEARESEPAAIDEILDRIGALYAIESRIGEHALDEPDVRAARLEHAKPVVEALFEHVEDQLQRMALLPSDPYAKALGYLHVRRAALSVYLKDPSVAIDTNHIERAIRAIPMGRRNWLFCWSELGAKQVGIIQSLITTCRLHGVDPSVYLTDVLQRVAIHPASEVATLTPRLWKTHHAAEPMRSDLVYAD